MVDIKAALTRKLGPLPVIAWAGIIGGGILVAKFVGIGGGAGAPAGESVQVGAGGALPDAFAGSDNGGAGADNGSGVQDAIDIPGGASIMQPAEFWSWITGAGGVVTPPTGDTPGKITLPGGSVVRPPDAWWDVIGGLPGFDIPTIPTIDVQPIPAQSPIPTPGAPVTPTGPATAATTGAGVTWVAKALIDRVEFLRLHEPEAARAYRLAHPIPKTETVAQRTARIIAEITALTGARIKRLAAEVTTLRAKYPIAAAAWRRAHPIPAVETPEQRERRLTAEVIALRSATR